MSHSKKSHSSHEIAFGIDVGGSGIKGAPVDLKTGEFAADRVRIPTPEGSTPEAVTAVIAELVTSFDLPDKTPVGIAFPAPILHGVVPSIANLDQSWAGVNLDKIVSKALDRTVIGVNDADAAGVGEAVYGAARDKDGTILLATLGTGIGSALLVDGHLLPNTEPRAPGDRRARRRVPRLRPRTDPRRPLVGAVGRAPAALLRDRRVPVLPRPHRRRRWREQAPREVLAAARPPGADHPGEAAQRGRDRRGGSSGGRRRLTTALPRGPLAGPSTAAALDRRRSRAAGV